MSFGNKNKAPKEEKKLLGVDKNRTSTNEGGLPLPVVWGRVLISTTHIGGAENWKTKPVTQRVGGKLFGSNETVGYLYQADFGTLVCHGVVTGIRCIKFDTDTVWSGNVQQVDDSPGVITMSNNRGTAYIYWGTANQAANSTLANHAHSPMRGTCYIFFDNCQLGRDRTNVPSIEVEIERYEAISGLAVTPYLYSEINPVMPIVDLWTNKRYGLGNDISTVDTASCINAANEYSSNDVGFSPIFSASTDVLDLMVNLCEYTDSIIRFDSLNRLQIIPIRPTLTPGNTILFDESDLLDTPKINTGSWNDTFSGIRLRFTSRQDDYNEDTEVYVDPANLEITGETREQLIERPWTHRQDLARKAAILRGAELAIPKRYGEITVRRSSALNLEVGDWFRITYSDWGTTQLMLCEEIHREESRSQAVTILFRAHPTNTTAVLPTDDPPLVDDISSPEAILSPRVIEPEYSLFNSSRTNLIGLGARGGDMDVGFFVNRSSDNSTFVQIQDIPSFCLIGELDAAYPDSTTYYDSVGFDITVTSVIDTELLNTTFDEGVATVLIAFVGDEILSIVDATLTAPGQYNCKCFRNQFGTQRLSHSLGDEVYFIERSWLKAWTDLNYLNGVTQYHKQQSYTLADDFDLSLISSTSIVISSKGSRPPNAANLALNGLLVNSIYSTGQNIVCDWDQRSWDQTADFGDDPDWNDPTISYSLEFLTTGDVLKNTIAIASGTNTYTYLNATIITDFGSEVDIRVKVWQVKNGLRATYPEDKTCTKV